MTGCQKWGNMRKIGRGVLRERKWSSLLPEVAAAALGGESDVSRRLSRQEVRGEVRGAVFSRFQRKKRGVLVAPR